MRYGIIGTALFALSIAGPAAAGTEVFHAVLSGASEVPPHDGGGTGEVKATLDTVTRELSYSVTFAGLSGPATMAHIHGPAMPGANAGVMVVLGGANPTSPIAGKATLTMAQMADLEAGRTYVNVHTAKNPKGEIRGQLAQAP